MPVGRRRRAVFRQHGEDEEQQPIFITAAELKEQVKERLLRNNVRPYRAEDFYKPAGIWQYIARKECFENAILCAIALNILWIAIDTDINRADSILDASALCQLMENMFCTLFALEWCIRLLAWQSWLVAAQDFWFVFDGSMMLFMIVEIWIMPAAFLATNVDVTAGQSPGLMRLFRLLRLVRVLRFVKLMRLIPELLVMLRGLWAAIRSVLWMVVLLAMVLFCFAMAFKQLSADTRVHNEYFDTLLNSMGFLLIHGTLLLSTDAKLLELAENGSPLLAAGLMVVVFITAVLMMNILVGILCQIICSVSVAEHEELKMKAVRDAVRQIMNDIDADSNGLVTRTELTAILDNDAVLKALVALSVNPAHLVELQDWMFDSQHATFKSTMPEKFASDPDDELRLRSFETASFFGSTPSASPTCLTLNEFMEIILQLRGTNLASQVDVLKLKRQADLLIGENQVRMRNVRAGAYDLVRRVKALHTEVEEGRAARLKLLVANWPEQTREFLESSSDNLAEVGEADYRLIPSLGGNACGPGSVHSSGFRRLRADSSLEGAGGSGGGRRTSPRILTKRATPRGTDEGCVGSGRDGSSGANREEEGLWKLAAPETVDRLLSPTWNLMSSALDNCTPLHTLRDGPGSRS
eukprot:TRINITY_DN42052_c0_g1_i1.p1 TRINITY_DN42052_c0_g1~~TRINITY_DN42052_c0_g1_i1.p1  ORF type:complete len:640 (+),score=86.32 TRINITY_DN42052_c0_g1_i1:106-2025(+)